MKILHTSDWHLGKKLEGRSRLNEQREVLDEIIEIADRENVDLVLVAGDVYDTFVPSAEAEDLFYEKIVKLAAFKRPVVVISGNHDDSDRLCAPIPLADKMGIYLIGNINEEIKTSPLPTNVSPLESGNGYMIFEDKSGEKVFIKTLPYPTEARFKEGKTEETFEEKSARWINSETEKGDGMPKILVGHVFVAGGKVSESERSIDLGGARAISPELFKGFDYVALGHLHKSQKMSESKKIYYSGSILQYSFDEEKSDKSVFILDVLKGRVDNIKKIQLNNGKKLVRLEATSVEEARELLEKERGKYVELTLKLSGPLKEDEGKRLRSDFTDLLTIKLEIVSGERINRESKKHLTDYELFTAYYKSKYGGEPSKEILELFAELIEENR